MNRDAPRATLTSSWISFWAGPVIGFSQQLLLFWLQPQSCNGRPWLAPALASLLTLLLAGVTLHAWRRLRRGPHAQEPPRIDGRTHFVDLLGVILPAFFLVACVWQLAATLIYPACLR